MFEKFARDAVRRPKFGYRTIGYGIAIVSTSLVGVAGSGTSRAETGPSSPALTAPDVVKVQGSTTFYSKLLGPNLKRIEKLAGVRVSCIPNKSIWGVIALLEKRADVAMISARMDGEIMIAKRTAKGLPYDKLREFNISSTRISFAVHPSNPVRRLTFDQVRKIFLGQIKNWSEVGGEDRDIRIVAVQDGGGTVVAVRKQMLNKKPLTSHGAIRIESAKHLIKVVEQTPGAIGIAQLGLVKQAGLPEIKTEKSVEQSLNLVTLGEPSTSILAFIEAARKVAAE
ncbi:MAG: substrate-binding domain-containing protein [Hyphomicrobiaceae bacterium]